LLIGREQDVDARDKRGHDGADDSTGSEHAPDRPTAQITERSYQKCDRQV
jgi:hypothetical protein